MSETNPDPYAFARAYSEAQELIDQIYNEPINDPYAASADLYFEADEAAANGDTELAASLRSQAEDASYAADEAIYPQVDTRNNHPIN